MLSRRFFVALAMAVLATLFTTGAATASSPYSEVVVFGDSISDTGNVFLFSGGAAAGPPYYEGRFSNGPVWVEVLAQRLGLPAPAASLVGGTNYAWGGAETGPGLSFFDTPNVGMQIDFFLADRGGLTGDELVVVLAGGNDLGWDEPTPPAEIAENISQHITDLAAAGGKTFLVPRLYALGQSPSARGAPGEEQLDTLSAEVNHLLDRELRRLERRLRINIIRFDMRLVVDAMLFAPEWFDLTNVTEPACPGCGIGIPEPDAADTIVPNPEEYLWWDFIHMTDTAHERIGELAAARVKFELWQRR